MENSQPVLIAGKWRQSTGTEYFQSANPQIGETLPENYPVSPWPEIEEAVEAAAEAFEQLGRISPEKIAGFLEKFADRIENRRDEFVQWANLETALPSEPRLNSRRRCPEQLGARDQYGKHHGAQRDICQH